MKNRWIFVVMLVLALISACTKSKLPPAPTMVPFQGTPTPTGQAGAERQVRETVVTVVVEKVVKETVVVEKIVEKPVQVTRIVEKPVQVPIEVTRIVTETAPMVFSFPENITICLRCPGETPMAVTAATTDTVKLEPVPGVDTGGCTYVLWTYVANYDQQGNPGYLYDFEAQSQVVQMNDFWVPGSETILVLERPIATTERSSYERGWGTAWVIHGEDREGCEEVDPIAIAAEHAVTRLDQGHAGLVIDFRSGITATVVAMLEGMAEARVQALWDMYRGARHDSGAVVPENVVFADEEDMIILRPPVTTAVATPIATSSAITVTVTAPTCGVPTRGKDFGAGEIGPFDDTVVVTPWGGKLGDQIAVMLEKGQVADLGQAGGATWHYPGCTVQQAAQDALANSGLPVYVLTEDGELDKVE